jgi:asparaginyl-tRNA synthetase
VKLVEETEGRKILKIPSYRGALGNLKPATSVLFNEPLENEGIAMSGAKVLTVKQIFSGDATGAEARVRGWVRTHRASKNVAFVQLTDGSCFDDLQLVVEPDNTSYVAASAKLLTGASVEVTGLIVESQGKGQSLEMQVQDVQVLGESTADYPMQKKGHSLEFLREHLHLRVRTQTLSAAARVRSECSFAIHEFFRDRGFFYVHTPLITASDCEGAGSLFEVKAQGEKGTLVENFFGKPSFLSVSGQLQVESYATALSKVYTFGPTFRAENSNTTRHLAEFWMIEPEMAFYDLSRNVELAHEFIKFLVSALLNRCEADLNYLHRRDWAPKGLRERLDSLSHEPLRIIEYTEAIEILQNSKQSFEFYPEWGCDLQTEHERFLTDRHVKGPVAVINYPTTIKPFYMKVNDDRTVRAMDVLVPGLGEIIGGSQREDDYETLQSRMRAAGIEPSDYQWYLDLRKFGSVEHSGFGLGLERFLMYVTGIQNIRDVIPFPRYPGHADC